MVKMVIINYFYSNIINLKNKIMQRKFKILIYNNIYVDFRLLDNGIYETNYPKLHKVERTIEELILQIEKPEHAKEYGYKPTTFIKNLKLCKLVEFELKEVIN